MEWITVVGVLATSATLSVTGLTLVLSKILTELREMNDLLRKCVAPGESVGYSRRDSPLGAKGEEVIEG